MLNFCPEDVRVAAWVKPFAVFKPNVNPAYAWEPVIWRGGRARRQRSEPTVRDWVSAEIALKKGLTGAKPPAFVWWLFALMGLRGNDTVIDIYPGTGVVGREWARFKRQQTLFTNGFTNDDEGTHSHPRSGVQTANALASPAATEGDRQEPRADYERDMLIGGKPLASQLNTLFVDTEGDQPTPIEPKNIYDCINCSDEAGQHWPNPNVGPFCFHCYHLLFPDPPVQP
jgi:hypothetical protein